MVVYLDAFMGLNFLVDWMLLLGVNRLAGYPPGAGRTAAAAVVGGGYAGMCLVPGFGFLAGNPGRWISLGLMSLTAFGLSRSAVQRGVLFVLLSMALGGLAICMETECALGVLGCSAALMLLCRTGFRRRALSRRLVPVEICHGGKSLRLTALCDTGNTLRDPLTGEPVLVAGAACAGMLLGLKAAELSDAAGTVAAHPELHLRLLPYGTVGNSGLLCALRCDRVCIAGKRTGGLVAFSPEAFGNGEYGALTGGNDG